MRSSSPSKLSSPNLKPLLLILAVLAAVFACPAAARSTTPLVLGPGGVNGELQQPVEQWTDWYVTGTGFGSPANWVVNPTGCSWDVDDHWDMIQIDASLAAGASVSQTYCQVADTNPVFFCTGTFSVPSDPVCAWRSGGTSHFRGIQVTVTAPKPGLEVTSCYQPQNRCFQIGELYNQVLRRYEHHSCIGVRYTPDDPAVAPILGSNGDLFTPSRGLGLLTYDTVTVSNPTGHTVKPIVAAVQMVGVGGDGLSCSPTLGGYDTFDYPFAWTAF